MKSILILSSAFLILSVSAPLSASQVDVLRNRQLTHSAANQKFLAKIELGHAMAELDTAQNEYGRVAPLKQNGAASRLEISNADIKVIDRKFAVKRAKYHLTEAKKIEDSWKLQTEWAKTNREDPVKLAKLFLELRVEREKILAALATDVKPLIEEISAQFEMAVTLIATNGIAQVEYDRLKQVNDESLALQKLADSELVEANTQLAEAQKDFDDLK